MLRCYYWWSGGREARGRGRERGIARYDIAQSISEKIGSDLWRDDRARRAALRRFSELDLEPFEQQRRLTRLTVTYVTEERRFLSVEIAN